MYNNMNDPYIDFNAKTNEGKLKEADDAEKASVDVDQDSNHSNDDSHDEGEDPRPGSEDSEDSEDSEAAATTTTTKGERRRRGGRQRRKARRSEAPLTEEEVERRRLLANWQERGRMDRLNKALANLRDALPPHLAPTARRLSKIRTLRLAIAYIRDLGDMLALDDARRAAGGSYYGGDFQQQQHQQHEPFSWAQPQQIHPHPYFRHPGYKLHHQQQLHQQWQPQQPMYVQWTPPSVFLASPNVNAVVGDRSFSDEGYHSSSFSDSLGRSDQSSFLAGPSHPCTPLSATSSASTPLSSFSTPYHPHPHPRGSSDLGHGGSFTTPGSSLRSASSAGEASSFLSPGVSSPPWLASTPTGAHGHFPPGKLRVLSDSRPQDNSSQATASFVDSDKDTGPANPCMTRSFTDSGRHSSVTGNATASEGRWPPCLSPPAPDVAAAVSPPLSSCRFWSGGGPPSSTPVSPASGPALWAPSCPPDSTSL